MPIKQTFAPARGLWAATPCALALALGAAEARADFPVPLPPPFGVSAQAGIGQQFWSDGGTARFQGTVAVSQPGAAVFALSDLGEGAMHATAAVERACGPWVNCNAATSAFARVVMWDNYVFTNTGQNIALMPTSIRLDGSCSGGGTHSARYRFLLSAAPITDPGATPWTDAGCSGTSIDITDPRVLQAPTGVSEFYGHFELLISTSLPKGVGGFSIVDFGDTFRVNIGLPEGVAATSASGRFPFTAVDAGPVPELPVWAMMIAGFGAVGAALRDRRRSTNPAA